MRRWMLAGALLAASCSSCVARGTRVRTPDGEKLIEELEVGDVVLAVNEETLELVATRIVAIQSAHREVGLIAAGACELRLTSDHPVYCPRERVYAPAGDWLLGERDQLLTPDGILTVARTATFVEVTEVFDITVDHELHNFVANGIVVHNKSFSEQCELEGVQVFEGDACECEDGAGRVDCTVSGAVCDCEPFPDDSGVPDDMRITDMGAADDGTNADTGSDLGPDLAQDMGGDASMTRQRGDCVTDDDCARPQWSCIGIPDDPNGHYTCQADVAAEPGCATIEAPDQCCVHADCTDDPSGTCVIGPVFYCGGVAPLIANVCLYDECAADSDCAGGQICLPPRVLGEPVARCLAAECGVDTDCTTRSGGQCNMYRDPCNGRVSGFFCSYDDSVCRTNDDCPDDPSTPGQEYCAPGANGDGDTVCASFTPPP